MANLDNTNIPAQLKTVQNWAVYFKITDQCNLSCSFCYNTKKPDGCFSETGENAASFLHTKILKHLSSSSGQNLQIILHGGEFTLKGEKWIREFMASIHKYHPLASVCAMSNLQSQNVHETLHAFRTTGGAIGTSFNDEVISQDWLKQLQTSLLENSSVNLNAVFRQDTQTDFVQVHQIFDKLLPTHQNWTFKFERLIDASLSTDEHSQLYQRSSEMILSFLEFIRTSSTDIDRHYQTFLFCILRDEIYRRRGALTRIAGNMLCDPRCCESHLVVDSRGQLGTCTKHFEKSTFWNFQEFPESTIQDAMCSARYQEIQHAILHERPCKESSCSYQHICNSGCIFEETLESPTECSANLQVRQYLEKLTEDEFQHLVQKSRISKLCWEHLRERYS